MLRKYDSTQIHEMQILINQGKPDDKRLKLFINRGFCTHLDDLRLVTYVIENVYELLTYKGNNNYIPTDIHQIICQNVSDIVITSPLNDHLAMTSARTNSRSVSYSDDL